MTFFYDLNKKLDEIRATPSKTHSQLTGQSGPVSKPKSQFTQALNERDMGKHNNATTGFKALAKKAGGGEKGERIAGAQFQKMKKAGQLKEDAQTHIIINGKDVDYGSLEIDGVDSRDYPDFSDAYISRATFVDGTELNDDEMDQLNQDYGDLANELAYDSLLESGAVPGMKESAFQAAIGKKKYGDQGMKALQKAGRDHASDKTMSSIRKKYDKYDESMGMADEGNEFSGELVKAKANHQDSFKVDSRTYPVKEAGMGDAVKRVGSLAKKVGGKVLNKLGHGSDEDMIKDLQRKMGVPQTGKKPNFADKIAGAKKEVDEMLGDVAAEAMKGALRGGQKKLDKNNNGKLDAMDFEMLRKGGKKEVGEMGHESHQSRTTMKHIPNAGSALKKAAKDIKPGVAGYRDRADMLRAGGVKGGPGVDEGSTDNAFTAHKRPRMDTPKVGQVTHGAKHDTEETPTGRKVTRRTDAQGYSVGAEDDRPVDGEKRGRGRPAGPAKAPERVTANATKHKGGRKVKENDLDPADRGEYDQEGEMAKDDIKTIVRHAQALEKILGDDDNLPEWVQSKLAKIESMMTSVDDYMQNQSGNDEEMAVGEESTNRRDDNAERAGKKVAKDIESDEKKKQDKPKKVKEQGGTDTPTASSGFGYGKGIYDSMNRELEKMIAESMSVNMSNSTEGNMSLTITATDEDALKLAGLLKNAGLGNGDGMEQEMGQYMGQGKQSCPSCGMSSCGCGDMNEALDENNPDYPTDQQISNNALQYSGGINGPKSTGQTTVPVLASQEDRQHTYEDDEALCRMMEMAGIQQDNLKPWERTMKEEVEKDDDEDDNAAERREEEAENRRKDRRYDELDEAAKCSACDCDPCECDESVTESFEQMLSRMRDIAGIREAKKPDFLDLDKDGDKKEPMAKAVADKEKKVEESIFALTNQWKAYKG